MNVQTSVGRLMSPSVERTNVSDASACHDDDKDGEGDDNIFNGVEDYENN